MVNKITLYDIARKAGVSSQTVSRVINNRPDVSRATRRRVQDIIDSLGYQPNAIARSLSTQRTRMIGAIIGSLDRYGPSRIFVELDKHAYQAGYRLLPYITHGEDSAEIAHYLRELLTYQPDGIIWAVMERAGHDEIIEQNLDGLRVPVVTMEASMPGLPKPAFMDQIHTSETLTTHLIEQGYKHIGIITGQLRPTIRGQLRIKGWRNALESAGFTVTDEQIADGDWSADSGEHAMSQLIQQYPSLDAVFACNDQMALGVLSYANRHGLAIPHQLGVVGIDDIPEAKCFSPPLTTARLPFEQFAELTVETLAKMIEANVNDEDYTVPDTVTLYPEIIIRESSWINAKRWT